MYLLNKKKVDTLASDAFAQAKASGRLHAVQRAAHGMLRRRIWALNEQRRRVCARVCQGQFVKLDPKVRAAVVVLPTFIAGYLLSRADLSIAVLALALYGRSLMAQSQVRRRRASSCG